MRRSRGSVEDLLAAVDALDDSVAPRSRCELWVPDELTLRGRPTDQSIAMAVVLDALLRKGFSPDGFEPGTGGRLYRYARESA